MLLDYLTAAMERAHYEIIEDEEPYYGEIPGLQGIWATGSSLEACRRNLMTALEDWVFFSVSAASGDRARRVVLVTDSPTPKPS